MKFGIQLFGVLKDEREDPINALRSLANLGFRRAEPCLSFSPIQGWEHVIWPADWFERHAAEIKALGLEMTSAHIFAENLPMAIPKLQRLAEDYGIRQFVVKAPNDLSAESLHQAALTYMQAADALRSAGAELLLHNEAADMSKMFYGRTAYEHLLSLCSGKVGAQVDVGWALYAGQDPEALLRRLGSLVRSLHYKDFRQSAHGLVPAPAGLGLVDTAACFQFARAAGIPQIIDQDEFDGDPREELSGCLARLNSMTQLRERTVSYLNTLDVDTGEVRVLRRFDRIIEAPNWLKKQDCILFNSEGCIYLYDPAADEETRIDTGLCDNCNNDHVVSFDEKELAVSHSPREDGFASRIYILPITGGTPRLVTHNSPSFLHGWSPDGRELAYCAFRIHNDHMETDIYTIPAAGGEEKRLTLGGFNDGPEYSPDGRHIWSNSTRSGQMQIWRMNRDGSEQTQMTHTDRQNWFGHISPDGKRVVYLSYRRDDLEAAEHLPNMQVELWIMDADGQNARRLLSLFGGQGSINVNSWSKDSRHIAFVSYELLPADSFVCKPCGQSGN